MSFKCLIAPTLSAHLASGFWNEINEQQHSFHFCFLKTANTVKTQKPAHVKAGSFSSTFPVPHQKRNRNTSAFIEWIPTIYLCSLLTQFITVTKLMYSQSCLVQYWGGYLFFSSIISRWHCFTKTQLVVGGKFWSWLKQHQSLWLKLLCTIGKIIWGLSIGHVYFNRCPELFKNPIQRIVLRLGCSQARRSCSSLWIMFFM